jgi:hypothetical protein
MWRSWEPPLAIVRGESYRQQNLRKVAGPPREHGYLLPVVAKLVREPTNPHDRNAVRVEVQGHHVGYIAREVPRQLSPFMRREQVDEILVPGLIRGGRKRRGRSIDLGVHLWAHRRLYPGPEIRFDAQARSAYEAPWPPAADEGTEVANEAKPRGKRDPGCVLEDPHRGRCGGRPTRLVPVPQPNGQLVHLRLCPEHAAGFSKEVPE